MDGFAAVDRSRPICLPSLGSTRSACDCRRRLERKSFPYRPSNGLRRGQASFFQSVSGLPPSPKRKQAGTFLGRLRRPCRSSRTGIRPVGGLCALGIPVCRRATVPCRFRIVTVTNSGKNPNLMPLRARVALPWNGRGTICFLRFALGPCCGADTFPRSAAGLRVDRHQVGIGHFFRPGFLICASARADIAMHTAVELALLSTGLAP